MGIPEFQPPSRGPSSTPSQSAHARLRTAYRLFGGIFAVLVSAIAALSFVLIYQQRILSSSPTGLRDTLRSTVGILPEIPPGKLPGPPREWGAPRCILDDTNSRLMIGRNDPLNERWRDVADNAYSTTFIAAFSYQPGGNRRVPSVRIRTEASGPTLVGRLEARGLKPNFAYQIKLRGNPAHRVSFEAIGYIGRWRLPGFGTNYSDTDYRRYPDWRQVESYVLFDYFVTDSQGNALRDFSLDSSLHVLWKLSQYPGARPSDLLPVVIDAADPHVYATPRDDAVMEYLWAERESIRYTYPDQVIRLPPGAYQAELVLTEETFHALGGDGGYWATVMACPVSFTITPETRAR